MNKDILKKYVIDLVPRVLGLQNRVARSAKYGCFDRQYWKYQTIDLPNARYQEAVLLLALLYKNNIESNIYYSNDKILKWLRAGIDHWNDWLKSTGSTFLKWSCSETHILPGGLASTYFICPSTVVNFVYAFPESSDNVISGSVVSTMIVAPTGKETMSR